MKERTFSFDMFQLLYYKCHKIYFKYGRLYIVSPDSIEKKKAIINTKNKDDESF